MEEDTYKKDPQNKGCALLAERWGERRDVGNIFASHQQLAGCMISHHSCSHSENCQPEDLSSWLRAAPACQSTGLTTSWQRRLLQSGALTLPQGTAHTGCRHQSPRCPQRGWHRSLCSWALPLMDVTFYIQYSIKKGNGRREGPLLL